MALLARGADYFGKSGFPVAVRIVRTEPGGKPSHAHDVTELDHYHDFCELVLVIGGLGHHVLEGEGFPVAAGNVFVVQGSQVHAFRQRQELVLVNVMYDPDRLPLPEALLRRIPGYSALFKLEPSFRRIHRFSSRLQLDREALGTARSLAEKIANEEKSSRPGREAALVALLLELIVFLSRQYEESETGESRSLLRMGQLISTLEQRYAETWTLESMARLTRLSRANLLRVFRQATGQSPIGFLISLRIEAAKLLLHRTKMSMTEIALETGFCDSNYFARKFREATGSSPTAYRESARF